MTLISRRDALAGLAASGAASFVAALGEVRRTTVRGEPAILSAEERLRHTEALRRYFADNAAKLLRVPDGLLKYPSISPSLPGKQYSTQLWDWDTLWTSRGLIRLAVLQQDELLRQKLGEHVSGSLLNFLEHASADGRMPIMMSATDADPFRAIASDSPSRNQAKPVFGQIGLLASDQRGEVQWLAPHFDTLLRFYESWMAHNMSSVGLLVWGDDVAIGDDNDPTTFGRPFFSSANLAKSCDERSST